MIKNFSMKVLSLILTCCFGIGLLMNPIVAQAASAETITSVQTKDTFSNLNFDANVAFFDGAPKASHYSLNGTKVNTKEWKITGTKTSYKLSSDLFNPSTWFNPTIKATNSSISQTFKSLNDRNAYIKKLSTTN